ncbi:N-acyl-D-glucosamine 2-epimerase, partial [Streptomyces lavendulocolor]
MSTTSDTVNFTFSDTIAGRVTGFDRDARVVSVVTPGGTEFRISLDGDPSAELLHNLGEPYQDATG